MTRQKQIEDFIDDLTSVCVLYLQEYDLDVDVMVFAMQCVGTTMLLEEARAELSLEDDEDDSESKIGA